MTRRVLKKVYTKLNFLWRQSDNLNYSSRRLLRNPFHVHYLKTVVELHSSTLRSTESQFILLKWAGLYDHEVGALSKRAICNLLLKTLLRRGYQCASMCIPNVHPTSVWVWMHIWYPLLSKVFKSKLKITQNKCIRFCLELQPRGHINLLISVK